MNSMPFVMILLGSFLYVGTQTELEPLVFLLRWLALLAVGLGIGLWKN